MSISREELACSAWFQKIEGIGSVTLFRLSEQFGGMASAYEASEDTMKKILSGRQFTAWKAAKYAQTPERYLEKVEAMGIRYVPFCEEIYPEKLRNIPDPPFGLFLKGSLPEERRASIAIIGARACSEYGKKVAKDFASQLAECGVQVISGMARGIDSISQKACLDAGGRTFAVLGSGVDVCYPSELKGLYDGIQEQGGLVSFYAPGTPPLATNFPPRNRIISGLADLILVIEARRKSGTWITVDMALEQGKEVAVIPGRITDQLSQGCHDLIKQGAMVVVDVEQVLEVLKDVSKCREIFNHSIQNTLQKTGFAEANLNENLRSIWQVLTEEPEEAEKLYTRWKVKRENGSFQSFMEGLVDLELMDLCKVSKKRFSIR